MQNPNIDILVSLFAQLKTKKRINDLLVDLLTFSEQRNLNSRCIAAQMLLNGCSYKEVEKETGLSSATTAKISEAIKYGTGGYKHVFNKLSKT